MTSNVISLQERRENATPHTHGDAVCLSCRHEWEAVVPVGTVALECPECGAMRGVRSTIVGASEGQEVFTCMHCDSHHMVIYRDKVMCAGCGWMHAWTDVVEE